MKKYIMIVLFFVFQHTYSQVLWNFPKQKKPINNCIFIAHPETHNINVSLIKNYYNNNNGLLTYSPLQRIKITLKAGVNGNTLSVINNETFQSNYSQNTFNETEIKEITSIIKYDARIKIYVNKKFRLLMRAQIVGLGKDVYTLGGFWKI